MRKELFMFEQLMTKKAKDIETSINSTPKFNTDGDDAPLVTVL